MASVLDAFFITIGLDISNFTQGQREADQAWTKTKDQTVAAAKQIEENTRKLATSFDTLKRQAIEFFAVIMGARGIEQFVSQITAANTQLGYLSANLQTSPQVISEWGLAVERAGGNASAAMSAFGTLSTQISRQWQQGKALPLELWQLQSRVSKIPGMANFHIDPSNAEALAESLAKAANAMAKIGERGNAFQYLTGAGIDPAMATVMIEHGDDIKNFLKSLQDLAPTNKQIKDSQDLTAAWAAMQQQAVAAGRAIVDTLTPSIEGVTDAITLFIKENKSAFSSEAVADVETFASALSDIKGVASDIVDLFKEFKPPVLFDVPKALGLNPNLTPKGGKAGDGNLNYGSGSGFFDGILNWWKNNWGIKDAHGGELTPEQMQQGLRGQPSRPITPTPVQASQFGAMPTMDDFKQGKLDVDGRPLSRGNPMPVNVVAWANAAANALLGGPMRSGLPLAPGPGGPSPGSDGQPPSRHAPPGIRRRSSGGTEAPAPEAAGTYRPVYKIGPKDTSNAVVNTIAGEALGGNAKSIDAVINNMLNRVGTHTYGPSGNLEEVARAPGQYAGYRAAGAAEAELIRARIRAIASGGVPDSTNGSNEYRASWYKGPWGWNHPDGVVVGGNKFAYNPRGGVGPYHAYDHAKHWPAQPHTPTPDGKLGVDPSTHSPFWDKSDPINPSFIPSWQKGLFREGIFNRNGFSGPHNSSLNPSSLSTLTAHHPVMTASTSHHVNVGDVHVNAPNATDSAGIANSIREALNLSLHASLADYGQA